LQIHSTAVVSKKAELGSNVTIGPYSIIGDRVILHDDVQVASHCVIEGPSEFGRGCVFYPFVSAGQAPHDLKYKGEQSLFRAGEDNVFREFVTLHRGTENGGNITEVGANNLFMDQCHIAHDCRIGSNVIMSHASALAGHVIIEDYATLGAFSGIHQFCRVGKHAFIGAHSVVVKDALPYARTVGNHAKCFGQNTLGLKRRGFSSDEIRRITHAFRLLLASKLNTTQALERIKHELSGNSEIDYLIEFIQTSERGVTK